MSFFQRAVVDKDAGAPPDTRMDKWNTRMADRRPSTEPEKLQVQQQQQPNYT